MGLSALNKIRKIKEQNTGGARYLKVDDGKRVKLRFLQELDEDSDNYSEKNGQPLIITEHQPIDKLGYLRKFQCTIEDGNCYGCEQAAKVDKKWKGKGALYANVLVTDPKEDEPYVAIFRTGVYEKNDVLNQMIFVAEEYGSITNRDFYYSRSGTGMKTVYTLNSLDPKEHDVEQYELFDLESLVKKVPYEEQEAYASPADDAEEKPAATEEVTSKDMSDEW